MIAETPLALSYILPADVFFLPADRLDLAQNAVESAPEEISASAAEPVVNYQVSEPSAAAPAIPEIVVTASVASAPVIPKIEIPMAPAPAIPTAVGIAAPATAPNFAYLGGFAQKFLVIVNYPGMDLMEPAHQKALESTIIRKEMTISDVAIFNIGKYPGTDLKAIARFFKPKRMLLLGRDSFPVGLADQPLNQLTLLGTCQLLYSDNFTDMMGNKEKTKSFWEQMKLL